MAGVDSVDGIALLVQEMKADDTEQRINAMKGLRTVAEALGPERTATELVPFLSEQVEDDDEVLLTMARQLGGFVELMGGPKQSVVLLEVLGSLATVEETVVRDAAVESANTITSQLDADDVQHYALPVLERLTTGDWFTSRVSACGMLAAAYGRLADNASKDKLRQMFKALSTDDTPMVRRAAAKHVGKLADVVSHDDVLTHILPLYSQLAADDQDSVRLLALENCVAFAKVLSPRENESHILPLITGCAEDKSWRVRNNVAKVFHALSLALGGDVTVSTLLPAFVKLLQDPEAEVRASAASQVSGYAELVGPDAFVAHVIPAIAALSGEDLSTNVRGKLAESLMLSVPMLGSALAEAHVLPFAMQFIRDEVAEVRLKVLTNLGSLVNTLASDVVDSQLVPALVALASDSQWRVREQVVTSMPMLARTLGTARFEEKLQALYFNAFHDGVNAVRVASTGALGKLTQHMGLSWGASKVVPELVSQFEEGGSYLQRVTVLYALRGLVAEEGMETLVEELLPLAIKATRDSVPNVRFVAAKVMQALVGHVEGGRLKSEVKPCLTSMVEDVDSDVKYFAGQALKEIA